MGSSPVRCSTGEILMENQKWRQFLKEGKNLITEDEGQKVASMINKAMGKSGLKVVKSDVQRNQARKLHT